MFESFKSMAAIAGIMKDLPRLKAQVEEVRNSLESIDVEASSGGGAVRVVASASMKVRSIHVDHVLLASLTASGAMHREHAEDLIVQAVNAALAKAQETAGREIAKAGKELGIDLPPGMLNGLLN